MRALVSMYIYDMSCLMRMMCMRNMHRYAVQRGSVHGASPEDLTDEPVMDWAGPIWRWKGPMAQLSNCVKAFSMFRASRTMHTSTKMPKTMQATLMPSGGPGRTKLLIHE